MATFPRKRPPFSFLVVLMLACCLGCGSGGKSKKADAAVDAGGGGQPEAGAGDGGTGVADAGMDAGQAKPLAYFEVLRELRERVRRSPDHLAARASELVANKDAAGLFELVRDQVLIHPRSLRGRRAALGATRIWGSRGALRSGLATPREKAELLRDLLREADFEADVVVGTLVDERQDALARYHEAPRQGFAVDVSEEDLGRWREQLGGTLPLSQARVIDPDGSQAALLSADLGISLTPPAEPLATDLVFDGSMPLVRFVRDGATVYANPLFRDAVLGESYTRNNPVRIEGTALETVSVRLWARRNHGAVDAPLLLAETSVDADVAAGRRFVLRTAPLLPLDGLLRARPDDVRAFLPAIELEGADVDEAEKALVSVAGTPFNIEGDRLTVSDTGAVSVEGVVLGTRADAAAALASATSLSARVNASRFDDVSLEIDVLDAADQPVEGLGAESFVVEEEGARMGASLRQNLSKLRVLLVFDASVSVPEAFRGEGLVTLAREIATDLFENPRAELSVAAVSSTPLEPFTRSVDEVERQVRETTSGSSSIWQGLATAESRNADLILFLSDMKATDERTDARRAAIVRGSSPVLVLGVGELDTQVAAEAVALTGGQTTVVSNAAEAKQAVALFTDRRKASYVLSYRAPSRGPSARKVRVSLAQTALTADLTYEVPDVTERGGPRGFTGLYLTVEIGTRSVTRTLAGAAPDAEPSIEDVQAVRDALFGVATLAFEPGPLPFSVALDEWIGERLEWERLLVATGTSYEAFLEQLAAGIPRTLPARFLLSGAPGYDRSESLTYDTHLRTLLIVEQPRFGEGRVERVDLLPFAELATSGADATEAWQRTRARSLHWAGLEAELGTSTTSLLAGENLVSVPAEAVQDLFGDAVLAARFERAAAAFDDDYTLLVPADGDPVAFWSVYEPSGSVLGVLEDGSGGATNGIVAQVERNLAFFDMIESMAQTGAVTGGAWLDLELAKARLVSYATLWIATVGDGIPTVPDGISPEDMAQDYVEGQIQDHLMGLLPGNLGDKLGNIEGWLGLVSAPVSP